MRKFEPNEQDKEDFEQERAIQKWMRDEGRTDEFEMRAITRTGRPRNAGVRASFSLDQKMGENSPGTFADIIAGSDGRGLYGPGCFEPVDIIDGYLACLGFNEEDSEWLIRKLLLSTTLNDVRSKTLEIDSEW